MPDSYSDLPAGFAVQSSPPAVSDLPPGFEVESLPAQQTAASPQIPNAFDQIRASTLARVNALMNPDVQIPVHPYGGAPLLSVPAAGPTDNWAVQAAQLPGRGMQEMVGGVEQIGQPDPAEKLRGAAHVLVGGSKVLAPALAGAAVAAPLDAAAWYAISKGTGGLAKEAAHRLGADPQDTQLAEEGGSALPLLYGGYKIAEGKLSDAIDSHNTQAAKLIEQDAAIGRGTDLGAGIVNEETPVGTNGWKVVPNSASAQGRPNYAVQDQAGKTLFAGNGRDVQSWLAAQGVERTPVSPDVQQAIVEQVKQTYTQVLNAKKQAASEFIRQNPSTPIPQVQRQFQLGYGTVKKLFDSIASEHVKKLFDSVAAEQAPAAVSNDTGAAETPAAPSDVPPGFEVESTPKPTPQATIPSKPEGIAPSSVENPTPTPAPKVGNLPTVPPTPNLERLPADAEAPAEPELPKGADWGGGYAVRVETSHGGEATYQEPDWEAALEHADNLGQVHPVRIERMVSDENSTWWHDVTPRAWLDREQTPEPEASDEQGAGDLKTTPLAADLDTERKALTQQLRGIEDKWGRSIDEAINSGEVRNPIDLDTAPSLEPYNKEKRAIVERLSAIRQELFDREDRERGDKSPSPTPETHADVPPGFEVETPIPSKNEDIATDKPATPQVEDGTKYVLPSFVTAQYAKGEAAAKPQVTHLNDDFGNWSVPNGAKLVSASGRPLAPAPKFDASTSRKRTLSLSRQRAWLVAEAQKEAEAQKDSNMARFFEHVQPNNYSRSDADTVNDYLFGDADGPTEASFAPTGVSTRAASGPKIETDAIQQSTGAHDSGPLGEQLPEGSSGTPQSGPVSKRSRSGSGSRQSRDGAIDGQGSELDAGAGTSQPGVGNPTDVEQVTDNLPPRASTTSSKRFEHDYRIPADRKQSGSPETRAKRNLEAIRTLNQIEKENRSAATVEEQEILAGYGGWGPVPQIFAANTPEWRAMQQELRSLVSAEEYESAQRSTTNANYTDDDHIRAMWTALQHLGAKPGMSWLEPAIGVGNFFGLQPAELLEGARRVGVDKERIVGRIAQLLYPDSGIDIKGFEEAEYPEDYFDAAVSNVPFGNFGVHDAAFKGKPYLTSSIHNYFFAKSLGYVRPGGVIAFITSSYTMDGYDKPIAQFRQYVQSKADFLGAVRLPSNALQKGGGTHVIADIIFLRRRLPDAEPAGEAWFKTERKHFQGDHGWGSHDVNQYYAKHPENILGKEGVKRGQFSATDYNIEGNVTREQLEEALKKTLPADAFQKFQRSKSTRVSTRDINAPTEQSKLGALFFDDKGNLFRKTSKGSAEPMAVPKPTLARIKGQLAIRNVLNVLMDLERKPGVSEQQLKNQRQHLNTFYDKYVKEFGQLSNRTNQAAMFGDPDAPLLVTLERKFDQKAKTAEKAPIFSRRILNPDKSITSAKDAKDALYIALNETGTIAWDRMADLTGKPAGELQKELEDEGIVYVDPKSRTWQTAEEYLSGSVRSKLREAQKYAAIERQFKRNVEALEKVMPEDIPPGEISAMLGVTWVPAEIYAQFAQDVLNASQPVKTTHIGNEWVMDAPWGVRNASKWATARVGAHDLLNASLNMRRVKVYDRDSDGTTTLNKTETLTAQAKQRELQQHFNTWLFSDAKRSVEMAKLYNDLNNDLRLRTYDGTHLTLPGMSRDAAVVRDGNLEPHQLAAIWRVISQPNVLLAHWVGTGKTYEMIAAGMELQRLGLIKRPMYVVPNATLTGWQLQFNALYPGKRVLVFSEKDLEKKRRQQVMAQIATGDWDAVVVPESSFGFLRVGDEIFDEHYGKLERELEGQVKDAQEAGLDTRIIKRMEKMKERLLTGLQDRRNAERQDNTVSWEQLGIDQLFVDEAHNFKKLGFTSKQQNVAGIDQNGNQKTFDLLMKMHWTQKHGRGVVFATGTPVTNTMGELFNLMKYLIEPELEARGLAKFDDWSANFGRTVDVFEPKPEGGGYQMKARFSQFVNLPELAQLFRSFADVVTSDMVDLPRPGLIGGGRRSINLELSEAQQEYLEELRQRAKGIRADPRGSMPDNMLAVYGDAGKMTLDMRLVDPHAQDEPGNRLNRAADEIHKIWEESKAKRSTQLVFSDLGIPSDGSGKNAGFSVYEELTRKLIERGVPANEIAYIHQAKNKAQRARLIQQTNDGVIRVLMGSTGKLGVGVNVQQKIIAMHHLDIPHRPSDLDQREGRGIRQGNENPEIHVLYYITKGSLDESKFANVLRKAKFINQVLQGKSTVRTAEDVGGMVPSLEMFTAMASGDPRVLRKIEIDAELDRLGAVYSGWRNEQYRNARELDLVDSRVRALTQRGADLRAAIATRDKTGRVWQIGKEKFEGEGIRDKMGAALDKLSPESFDREQWARVGTAYGLPLEARQIRELSTATGKPTLGLSFRTPGTLATFNSINTTGTGLVMQIENHTKGLDGSLKNNVSSINQVHSDAEQYRQGLDKPWSHQKEYDKLIEEQKKLIKELGADKGDDSTAAFDDDEEIKDASVSAEAPESEDDEEESPETEEYSEVGGTLDKLRDEDEAPAPAKAIPSKAEGKSTNGFTPIEQRVLAEVKKPREADSLTEDLMADPDGYDAANSALAGLIKKGHIAREGSTFRRVQRTDSGVVLGSGLGALQPYVDRFLKQDVIPTAKQVAELLRLAKDDIQKILAPAAREGAQEAALSVRANASELARSTDRAEAALAVAKKYFDAQPAQQNFDFIDRVESGMPQPSPDLQAIADLMRKMLDTRRTAIQALGTGKLDTFIEDYFPHVWENPKQAQQAFQNQSKRPLQGAKSFLKKRTIETFADGLALGLTPISTNPVELVLAKTREMDKYLTAHRILADLADVGQLKFLRATKPLPEGWSKIEDNVATVWGTPSHEGARQIEGYYIAPEPAARILNHYLSPGLREKSALFRTYLGTANLLNQAQLGFSAFHLAFTTMDVATSKFALALYQGAHGDLGKALKSAALTPISPFLNIMRGDKMLREWYRPGTQGALLGELVDAMAKAGGRAKMDAFYTTNITKRMVEAWRGNNLFGALIRLPGAAMEISVKPIMEYIVPRQKMGVFADLAQYELERLGPNASDKDVQAALAKAWDSVDNRLGQLVYDNLFWHKVMKDLAMATVRSVGWNVGTIRELGGGLSDSASFVKAKLGGKGGPDDFTTRMSYLLALQVIAGLTGAIAYYLWHGHAPHTLKDYYFPKDSHGRRWTLPTYAKDEYAWTHDPARTAQGKIHPLLSLLWEMLSNKDYFDHAIANPHHPWVKRQLERAEFALKQFEPIAYREDRHGHHPQAEERVLGFFGVKPAPKSLDKH